MTARSRLEVTAAVASLLSVFPLLTLTQTSSWIVSAAVAIALVAASGHALRRLTTPRPLIPLVQFAVLLLWTGVTTAGDVAWLGFIPNPEWATRLADVFNAGVSDIGHYEVPIPVSSGVLMILVASSGAIALVVDILAVALRRVVLSGLAFAAPYLTVSIVPPGSPSPWWFLFSAGAFLAVLVADSRVRITGWGRAATPSPHHSGIPETDSLVRSGRRVGGIALVTAVTIPALVPVLSEGLLDGTGSGGGGGDRVIRTDNPIVDLQRNLNRPDNVEILRYTNSADQSQYIRTVALDEFDGQTWRASNRDLPDSQMVDNGLPEPPGLTTSAGVTTVDYTFDVTDNFGSHWLPLPYAAQEIDIEGDWRYDADTLDVVGDGSDAQGQTYHVRTTEVVPTAEALTDTTPAGSELDELTELPTSVPEEITELARDITADATNDFERAVALQDWFRSDGGFVYDISIQEGHSNSALLDFVTEKRGYCEQFAATMAIMARSLDIPARVAVGFTGGDAQPDSSWVVHAWDSHSWPELYFSGTGWVRFEPTPGARASAPSWTEIPTDDNAAAGPSAAPSTPPPAASTRGEDRDELAGGAAADGSGPSSNWPLVVIVAFATVGIACLPSVAAASRRALRWRRARRDPVAGAEAAWANLREAALDSGQPWDSAATPRATGRMIARRAHLHDADRDVLEHLVTAIERARYAREPMPADSLRNDVAVIRRALRPRSTRSRRINGFLWPTGCSDLMAAASRNVATAVDRSDAAIGGMRASMVRVARTATRR